MMNLIVILIHQSNASTKDQSPFQKEESTKDSGTEKPTLGMVLEYEYGLMDLSITVIGDPINPMERE